MSMNFITFFPKKGENMKIKGIEKNLMAAMLLGTVFLAGCSGDDSLSTVEKNHEPDYEF